MRRTKWRYVFSQIEENNVYDINNLREEVLNKLRQSPDELHTNPAAISALNDCLYQVENGNLEGDVNNVIECLKERLKNSGNGEIYRAIDNFLSGQPMSSMDLNSWNRRRIEDPFRGFKNPNI